MQTMDREPQLRVRSFEQLYRSEYRGVVAFSLALLGNRQTAEDVTQDAFIETHKRWDRIQNYDDPGAWVRKVASNKAISRHRRLSAELRALTNLSLRDTGMSPETMAGLARSMPRCKILGLPEESDDGSDDELVSPSD